MYDVTNRESFDNAINLWYRELREKGDEKTGLMVSTSGIKGGT